MFKLRIIISIVMLLYYGSSVFAMLPNFYSPHNSSPHASSTLLLMQQSADTTILPTIAQESEITLKELYQIANNPQADCEALLTVARNQLLTPDLLRIIIARSDLNTSTPLIFWLLAPTQQLSSAMIAQNQELQQMIASLLVKDVIPKEIFNELNSEQYSAFGLLLGTTAGNKIIMTSARVQEVIARLIACGKISIATLNQLDPERRSVVIMLLGTTVGQKILGSDAVLPGTITKLLSGDKISVATFNQLDAQNIPGLATLMIDGSVGQKILTYGLNSKALRQRIARLIMANAISIETLVWELPGKCSILSLLFDTQVGQQIINESVELKDKLILLAEQYQIPIKEDLQILFMRQLEVNWLDAQKICTYIDCDMMQMRWEQESLRDIIEIEMGVAGKRCPICQGLVMLPVIVTVLDTELKPVQTYYDLPCIAQYIYSKAAVSYRDIMDIFYTQGVAANLTETAINLDHYNILDPITKRRIVSMVFDPDYMGKFYTIAKKMHIAAECNKHNHADADKK